MLEVTSFVGKPTEVTGFDGDQAAVEEPAVEELGDQAAVEDPAVELEALYHARPCLLQVIPLGLAHKENSLCGAYLFRRETTTRKGHLAIYYRHNTSNQFSSYNSDNGHFFLTLFKND